MGCAVSGDNTIIFGNLNGDIFALNKTGNLIWKYNTGTRVNSPAIGKTIYNLNYFILRNITLCYIMLCHFMSTCLIL